MAKTPLGASVFDCIDLYLKIFRPGPVTNCRPEPPCVVTDIPKRVITKGLPTKGLIESSRPLVMSAYQKINFLFLNQNIYLTSLLVWLFVCLI